MSPRLRVVEVGARAWKVGYRPDPWVWVDWSWAGPDGRFHGRWDDSRGNFRTVYAGASLLGCLLEVLAVFRPDPALVGQLAQITDNDPGCQPTVAAGLVPYSWLERRAAATAWLAGSFCEVTSSESVAALHPP